MGEGVDGGVILYGRCKNRDLCIVSIAEDIMFGHWLGLSVHDR